jgi:WD40 repeat protein
MGGRHLFGRHSSSIHHLLSASYDGTIKLWDTRSKVKHWLNWPTHVSELLLLKPVVPHSEVGSLQLNWILTESASGLQVPLHTLQAHKDKVCCIWCSSFSLSWYIFFSAQVWVQSQKILPPPFCNRKTLNPNQLSGGWMSDRFWAQIGGRRTVSLVAVLMHNYKCSLIWGCEDFFLLLSLEHLCN